MIVSPDVDGTAVAALFGGGISGLGDVSVQESGVGEGKG